MSYINQKSSESVVPKSAKSKPATARLIVRKTVLPAEHLSSRIFVLVAIGKSVNWYDVAENRWQEVKELQFAECPFGVTVSRCGDVIVCVLEKDNDP